MPGQPGRAARYRVEFDDAAFAEDLRHNTPAARTAGELEHREIVKNGLDPLRLKRCEDVGRDGTKLPKCAKIYIPEPDGPWGMVLELRIDDDRRPYLACLAFGTRHPTGPGKLSDYQVASRRLERINAATGQDAPEG
jgi:predicted acyl esterase